MVCVYVVCLAYYKCSVPAGRLLLKSAELAAFDVSAVLSLV